MININKFFTESIAVLVVFIGGTLAGGIMVEKYIMNRYYVLDKSTTVSCEYVDICRCGGQIEGYYSFVDGTTQEHCTECGYHKEVVENE